MFEEIEEFKDFIKDSKQYGFLILIKSLISINRLYLQSIYVRKVLDFAKENEIRFTFFITAKNLKKKHSLINRMIDEGHEIGSHSYNHILHGNKTYERVAKEFIIAQKEFKKYGVEPLGFRAPFLSINESVIKAIGDFGMKYSSNIEGGSFIEYKNGVTEVPIINPYDWKGIVVQGMNFNMLTERWSGQKGTLLLHPWVIANYLHRMKDRFIENGQDYRIISNYKKRNLCISFDVY